MHTSIRSRRALLLALFATATGVARAQNVGVGTLTPSEKLDVVGGNLKLSTAGSRLIFPDGTFQTTAASGTGTGSFILNNPASQQTGNFNLSGSGTLGGTLNASNALLKNAGNGSLELQTTSATATTPYIDFSETSGTPDYSTRLISSGGVLTLFNQANNGSQSWQVNGAAGVTGNSAVGGNETVAGTVQAGTNVVVDAAAGNTGTAANTLRFGGSSSGEGIGSKRSSGGNQYGLDFYTSSAARLSITGGGNVGIGTTTPGQALEVNGNVLIPLTNDYLLRDTNHGLGFYGAGKPWNGLDVNGPALYGYGGGVLGTNQGGTRATALTWNSSGNVGIGTTTPGTRLDVVGGGGNAVNLRVNGRLQTGDGTNQGGVWLNSANSQFVGQFDATKIGVFNGGAWRLVVDDAGKVGIGTTGPSFPLDVQTTATTGAYSFGYLNPGGQTGSGSIGANGVGISIRATGRILSSEFNAVSDRRLKTVVGLSDRATDLALLNRLRITDYTMRDRVQFGNRAFKKVIAQEVEAVFPQAVQQQTGFLPDIYALATAVQALPGDSLVALTLPAAGLPVAATAGQRLKLVGNTGEVLAALARPAAAGARTLVLRRATALAGTKVFVFGLEHADVRSVDYEALSMLNVSATQELARKVELLEKQNAALQAGSAADHASLLTLQAQVARLLGEGAQAQK